MNLTRRQFMAALGASTAYGAIPPPRNILRGPQPLFEHNTLRPLRYTPEAGSFVIRNGGEFFNRPLYGPNIDFRVDAGDVPEFSLYLPGHGGNLKLGMSSPTGWKWLSSVDNLKSTYRPGRMIYDIKDPLLGHGILKVEALTTGQGSGLLLRIDAVNMLPDSKLIVAFAGVSGRKGSRNGDIGCENEPVSRFFQVRAEECAGNRFLIDRHTCRLESSTANLDLSFPVGTELKQADFAAWNATTTETGMPILLGSTSLTSASPLYISILRERTQSPASFEDRSLQLSRIASTLQIQTPDEYINAAVPALCIAADALWDNAQQSVMHGCVAWRSHLAGWRGPYSLASVGYYERMKQQVRHWIARQNTKPIDTTTSPVTGPFDANSRLSRKEALLHSNGDLSGNHYDMNMVFFDVFFRYLRWTADLELAREVWPALQRHLAWEQRLFRRLYTTPAGRQLPLYEAYAVIWASDNLQYNGGGATHSSAYNLFAFRMASSIARLLGEDPAPYETEANLLSAAIEELLWIPSQGAYAESKDILGPQATYTNPALWTVYHTIDSEVPDPRQAWQMAAERLSVLRKVPIRGPGVPTGDWYLLSCSDWLPYLWSLNLLALGENMHTALALWQVGMPDEAYRLFKGNLLDSLFMGLSPGNFHMSSELDVHRQEAQRDFGDPIGITARALTEGLFGLHPDLLHNRLTIHPGFPSEWTQAALTHPSIHFEWTRKAFQDAYSITSRFSKNPALTLILPARTTTLPRVSIGSVAFDASAVGHPRVIVSLPPAPKWDLSIDWTGTAPALSPAPVTLSLGEPLPLPPNVAPSQIDDPQQSLSDGRASSVGFHTVFTRMSAGQCQWSMPVSFHVKPALPLTVPALAANLRADPLDLTTHLQQDLNQIFTRDYSEPRSPYCSLSIPSQLLGGWANNTTTARIDAAGLHNQQGKLDTPLGISFRLSPQTGRNCLFVSDWKIDRSSIEIPLTGRAAGAYFLLTGITFPQASRMENARITVAYADSSTARLPLTNPETFWPIEQDYQLDDYLFVNEAPAPPRIDLRTGALRNPSRAQQINGGAATILHLPVDPNKPLASLKLETKLYGVVVALLAVTLARPKA